MVALLRPVLRTPGRATERVLAALFLACLATYAIGTSFEDSLPTLHDVGVVGVHLAVLLALVLPFAVVVHWLIARTSGLAIAPRFLEVVAASTALVAGIGALWLDLRWDGPVPTVLVVVATLAMLALAGLFVTGGIGVGESERGAR